MKIVSGVDLLNLGKAMAKLDTMREEIDRFCGEQFICASGHETNGGSMKMGQKTCECGAKFIFRRIPEP